VWITEVKKYTAQACIEMHDFEVQILTAGRFFLVVN
jgi:hypothetical protein